jgi:hypothetical protein
MGRQDVWMHNLAIPDKANIRLNKSKDAESEEQVIFHFDYTTAVKWPAGWVSQFGLDTPHAE